MFTLIFSPKKILPNKKISLILHPLSETTLWKDAGVVDRDGLENRCTLTGTEGSNPSLSATLSDASQTNQVKPQTFNKF